MTARRALPAVGAGVVGIAGAAWAAVLKVHGPHFDVGGVPLRCPTTLVGLWCPGCGSTRALAELLDGDVAAAFSYNALAPFAAALLVWAWVAWAGRAWRTWTIAGPAELPVAVPALVVVAAFTVARNLPQLQVLAP